MKFNFNITFYIIYNKQTFIAVKIQNLLELLSKVLVLVENLTEEIIKKSRIRKEAFCMM